MKAWVVDTCVVPRVEPNPTGTFNTTEFGSVKHTDQFQALCVEELRFASLHQKA